MTSPRKLLFLCSRNQRRSITAEHLCRGLPDYEARSAGTDPGARLKVKAEDIAWADMIFVMEPRQLQSVRRDFKRELKGKRLVCLQIPDKYGGMSLELVEVLKNRLRPYIQLPD